METYVSFSMDDTVFLDSFQFLLTLLEKPVSNLAKEGPDTFVHTRKFMMKTYPDICIDKLDLLLMKGVYPYDYIHITNKFEEKKLPPKEAFHNFLTEEHISDNE